MSIKLNKSNGDHVDFYIENNGFNSVVATINTQSEQTFKAGEKGCVCLEISQDTWEFDKEFKFKAVPGINGGSINVHYEITQSFYGNPEN